MVVHRLRRTSNIEQAFRCSDVVKPLSGPPHTLLKLASIILISLAKCIPWPVV